MASMALATREGKAEIIEQVMLAGDLARLTPEQRVAYYMDICASLELNPRTRPFEYMTLKNKLVLYAKKDCAEQLRKRDNVSIIKLDTELSEGVYIVTAYARNGEGRQDTDVGVVNIENLRGEDKSNAMMKAITKAKRRVTLSICGLGFLDETEIDSIPDARPVRVDIETGVIEGEVRTVEPRPQPSRPDNGIPPSAPLPSSLQEVVERANGRITEETGDDTPFYGSLPVATSALKAAGFYGWKANDGERIGQMENELVRYGVEQSKLQHAIATPPGLARVGPGREDGSDG